LTISQSISPATSRFHLSWRINWLAYCIVLPAIVIRCAFTVVPMVQTFLLSLTNKNLTNEGRFIGLTNYLRLAQDSIFLNSLTFTLLYTAFSVILELVLGLLVAMMLMRVTRFKLVTNLAMLLPWVMAPLLAATVWKIMYLEHGGILNELLLDLGIVSDPVRWLSDGNTARVSVTVTTVWKNLSWVALIFMAALGALPRELYEAANIDGANAFQKFRYITIPLLKPSIYLVLMFRGMAEVVTFEQIGGLTGGGPGSATTTLAVYAYQRFFQELRYGYGSTVNVILLLVTVLIGGFFAWRLYGSSR
jgi:ABC-type sugar transport system permease subunit